MNETMSVEKVGNVLFRFAAYSLDEIEKESKALRAAVPVSYKTPDDASALDVSVTCNCVSELGLHCRVHNSIFCKN